jgi:subtilisin-like proprotein convertase family protein/N-acetylneuraminic acid mutarotase
MQPKFTLQSVRTLCFRIIATALIFSASANFSFAQQKPTKVVEQKPGFENTLNNFERQKLQQAPNDLSPGVNLKGNSSAPNDAGVAVKQAPVSVNRTEAVCTTFTYSITSSDPPVASRAFRDGVNKTCASPGGPCQTGLTGSFNYKIFQWLCPVTQCVTITYNATNASFSFFTIHNAPPTIGNYCANWVSDPGSSATAGTPIVFSFNGTAGTTYYFMVTNVGAVPSNGTIQIDANVCFASPCTGTPAPGNTIATPNPVGAGSPFTLSIQNNPPASGFVHHWQSAPASTGPWTTIGSGPANTFNTSQTVATWYRDSVVCTASNQFGISTPVLVNLLACGWSTSTVYPITVLDQGCVTVGGDLYSFAGVSNNAVIANSYKFNGTAWTPIAPTPQALEYPGVCTDGSNVYILGGASSTGTPLTTLYRYNVATNTYTTLAPFTTGAWNPTAVYLAGKIYKFCGTGAAGSVNNLEIYDVASNTWTTGAPYPLAISFVSAVAQGGFIYAGGGIQTVGTLASLKTYRYDPGTNTWNDAAIADLPATRWGAASAWYNNGFIMAGGYVGGSVTANISTSAVQWDQATNAWTALANMSTGVARVGGAAFGIGGSFYVVGGRTQTSAGFVGSNQNQRLFCIPPTPCSGTPNPGNTVSTSNPVCSGTGFTLSVQNNPFVSGFTYLWQSAPASAGPWTNLPGGTNVTHSLTQTGATWYRCIVTCTPSGLSGTSTPLLVADGQGVFNTHPANTSVQCSGNTSFSFTATGSSLVYAWEYRVNASSPWLNVANGAGPGGVVFGGAATNTLTLAGVPTSLNGYQFRGLISGPCTAIDFSNVATLTVTPLVATVNVSSPVTICTGTVVPITLTNSATSTTTTFSSGPLSLQIPDLVGPPASPAAVCNAGINHTIPVSLPVGSQISRIDVRLNITHTYASDLIIVLRNQTTGQTMNLFYHKSGAQTTGANFVNTVISSTGTTRFSAVPPPFTGTFRADWEMPPGSYGDATGAGPTGYAPTTTSWATLWGGVNQGSGNWTIAICDPQEWAGDIGTLTSWSMDITYGAPATGIWTQTSPASPNSMFTDAAATIPYTGGLANTIYVKPLATSPFTGNSATYCVVYSTTSPACTSAPTCINVNVTSPISGLQPVANKAACVGTNTSFTVTSGGGPLTYQWQVSVDGGLTYNNIAGATSATLSLTAVTQVMNNNLYRCVVTAAPCGSQTSSAGRLTVNPLPVVSISSTATQLTPGQVSTFTATSTPAALNANSYVWLLNGSAIPGVTGSSVTANVDALGTYQASVTDINGCVNTSNIITLGAKASDRLWIYPNPNTGQFQVRLYYNGVQAERRIVRIYTIGGQLVQQKEFDLVTMTAPYLRMDFDLSRMAAATYVVKVVDSHAKEITSGLVVIQ